MSSEDESKCFTVTWKIENFSFYSSAVDVNEALTFPAWKTETTQGSEWWKLGVYYSNPIVFFGVTNLKGEANHSQYEMTLLTSRGKLLLISMGPKKYIRYIDQSQIFGDNRLSIFPQDTLTLSCRILHKTMIPGGCLFRTALHRVNFLWKVHNFRRRLSRTMHQKDNVLLAMCFSYCDIKGTYYFQVELLPNLTDRSAFVNCQISIKDGQGRVISHAPSKPCLSWSFDFENVSSSLGNNLQLELESIVAVHSEYQQYSMVFEAVSDSSNTLSDDLSLLLKEGLHSDATLNTEGKSFSAHKSILAARSRVFRAMFADDRLAEGSSGVVNIEDVDSDTMDRMLIFLYGDSIEDVQWEEAKALYYAADKYAVHRLKHRCVDILKAGLAVSNACDALVLADKHSDQELMRWSIDFIREHDEVISSTEWDKLEDSNPRLTSKITRELYLKRGEK